MPEYLTRLGSYETTAVGGETTGRQRGKIFVYGAFLDLLGEGTDPLPR
jgi:hypothetical protein